MCFFIMILLLVACNPHAAQPNATPSIKVAAAADLTHAFKEVGEQFKKEMGIDVTFIFGSSGQLAEQIKQGAPFDMFASANVAYVDELIRDRVALEQTKNIYAFGRIGLAVKEGVAVTSLQDLLKQEVKKVAIANPDHAPYGLAAKQALIKSDIWEQVKPKLVYGKNIADTLAYVESGNVEVAIVALALMKDHHLPFYLIDEHMHEPIRQAVVVVKTTKHEKEAREFLTFLKGPIGTSIMKKYGFIIPEEE
ncbi:molybdate ABC transporter substrate-binding protein [Anoxybacillus sp. CHMUD]|uniref:molybdate ABC transporter substrate-binding protein n=1 Tax=Anoxybacillus sp. CHMUD TaxID=2508870 RepID=UPI001C0F38FF|nr:molybdate ABC transporter substrate-binding protein [Anoxybacillus sp. CHMUD]